MRYLPRRALLADSKPLFRTTGRPVPNAEWESLPLVTASRPQRARPSMMVYLLAGYGLVQLIAALLGTLA
ncbi:MAG: hypothetical protein U5M50_08695 [Sphingobium sp.]|nr:hypothetical protein [Sphingobium sp.]